uniref:mitochondrial import receptor subunit TOM40 homolog n=1 Tax=Lonchura striata TaxID=40157 RepID=UPI00129332E6|nr:mitochondrial import receptor subunit TOM40 homolog [Lonchura striata domestica]
MAAPGGGRSAARALGASMVNHTVALSTLGESNYHFGATYVGTKHLSPTEAFPVLVGDMDNSGSLNAQVVHQVSARIRSKIAFQVRNSGIFGNFREFSGILGENLGILGGFFRSFGGILVAHYLQSVTPQLALGAELVYHRRPGEEGAVLSLAGRYSAPAWIGTVTLGQAGAHLTYYHRASEQVPKSPKITPKSAQNQPKISPKSAQNSP